MRLPKQSVLQLLKIYKTNNPFTIASRKGITVLYEQLGDILGYYSTYKRMKFIHLNRDNGESVQRFVIAHELGHVMMHPNLNTPFLRKNTLLSVDRIEREANEFAVELLISDKLLLEGVSIYDAAAACGVPEEVAHLKSKPDGIKASVRKFWTKEDSYFTL